MQTGNHDTSLSDVPMRAIRLRRLVGFAICLLGGLLLLNDFVLRFG